MKITFFAVVLLGAAFNIHAESYLCVADKITGFKYDIQTKTWNYARFNVESEKYVLTRSDNHHWELRWIGKNAPYIRCMADFDDIGTLICGERTQFKMNTQTMRYLIVHSWGYWSHRDDQMITAADISPYMEIGKCSKIP